MPTLRVVPGLEEIWLPLVDEPIGGIVEQLRREQPELHELLDSPRRVLAFRTFAYIRVGLKLGQLLFDNDVPPYDGSETWVDGFLREPKRRSELAAVLRQVAEQIASDPAYRDEEPSGPDDEARARMHAAIRRQLDSA
jgi:hypothetical protein